MAPHKLEVFKSGYFENNTRSSEQEWKIQGVKFYKKKCFDQAIKCFTFAGEDALAARCTAFMVADKGQNALSEIEAMVHKISNPAPIPWAMEKGEENKLKASIKLEKR